MKWKASIAVAGVFLLGLVGGALLGQVSPVRHLWGGRWHHFTDSAEHRRGVKHGSRGRYIRVLQRELDLSERQMAEIGPLLNQTRRDLYQARIRSLKETDRIILEFHDRMAPALDEAQARKLEELTGDFRERRSKKRQRMMSRLESLHDGL